mgnify:CR=1 FL=1
MSFEIQEPAVAYNHLDSIEEFLDYIDPLEGKYEFWDGAVVMMAGSTQDHAEIRDNFNGQLKSKLKERGCKSFQESVYLRMKNKDKTLYLPDIILTCDPEDISGKSRFVRNPSIIVEILSDSTSSYDRGEKWEQYRKIPSLRYYVLVSQQKPLVEVFGRPHAHSLFYFEAFEGLDAIIDLHEMDLKISMQEIYDGFTFETIG